jgi:hypothetical protein
MLIEDPYDAVLLSLPHALKGNQENSVNRSPPATDMKIPLETP